MEKYIGTKEIKAVPMTRGEYNKYRVWEIPADENPEDEGYLVEYLDSPSSNHPNHEGYVSWSPTEVFEKSYKVNGRLSFGQAVDQGLKKGKRITRSGWNGKGMFIFMQVPAEIPMDTVPKMQSLPQSVKDVFIEREQKGITYKNQIAMVYPDNTIYGWVASPSDVLEEDWIILD